MSFGRFCKKCKIYLFRSDVLISAIADCFQCAVGYVAMRKLPCLVVFCKVSVFKSRPPKTPFKQFLWTPQTLGVDRIALATAAFYQTKGNTVVIRMRHLCDLWCRKWFMEGILGRGQCHLVLPWAYRAMHEQKLPNCHCWKRNLLSNLIGNTTETSMHSCVVNWSSCKTNYRRNYWPNNKV